MFKLTQRGKYLFRNQLKFKTQYEHAKIDVKTSYELILSRSMNCRSFCTKQGSDTNTKSKSKNKNKNEVKNKEINNVSGQPGDDDKTPDSESIPVINPKKVSGESKDEGKSQEESKNAGGKKFGDFLPLHRLCYLLAAASYWALLSNDIKIFNIYQEFLEDLKNKDPKVEGILIDPIPDPHHPTYWLKMKKENMATEGTQVISKEDVIDRARDTIYKIHACITHPSLPKLIYSGLGSSIIGFMFQIRDSSSSTSKARPVKLLTTGLLVSIFGAFAYGHLKHLPLAGVTQEDYLQLICSNVKVLEYEQYAEHRDRFNSMKDLMEASGSPRAHRERKKLQ